MECAWSDTLQRRTALVGKELGRYGIEVAALSETRFAEEGEIKATHSFGVGEKLRRGMKQK